MGGRGGGGGGGSSSVTDKCGEDSSSLVYRECLRNHAASLGSYATDGCGEFTVDHHDMSSGSSLLLQCAACGCHRNFHRKVTTYPPWRMTTTTTTESGDGGHNNKKRFRSKFSAEQKEKMLGFAEKLGWKLQRKDLDEEIERFCTSIGVTRQVFKVWMHNHKNSCSSASTNLSSLTHQH